MSINNEDIELACKAFHKAVDGLIDQIQKRKKRRGEDADDDEALQSDCKKLVRHANHVLRTLTAKRTSLQHAIAAFKEASIEYVRQFSALKEGQEEEQRHILRKWFANYLRLRDGFVLLESGERRHPHDGDDDRGVNVSERKYRSRLKEEGGTSRRRDGKTRKFSSEKGYSGAGYDEFYDEDVGIRRRLLKALSLLDGRKSREDICEKLFDRDCSGAKLWENQMDEHINRSKDLRVVLNSIQQKFENDMNKHLIITRRHRQSNNKKGGGAGAPIKFKLVTDDKSERVTLGSLDIARQGNAFTISDAGGSLPFGMTGHGWKKKFELVSSSQKPRSGKVKSVQKKRKRILEDSSSDEDEENNVKFNKAPSAQVLSKKPSQSQTIIAKDNGDDGLAVRVREATDVSGTTKNTTSLDEMKRQLGVNNDQLQQSREQLEEEQLRSKIAADDEDMQEGLLGERSNNLSTHAPLLKACLSSRAELRKNDFYNNDFELLRESEEIWADFDNSLSQWKEHFQALLLMRKDISNGILDESSDHAYTVREDFREANMLIGIDSMEVHEFFSSRLQKNHDAAGRCSTSVASSLPSLEDSLSMICHSYLRFAEGVFKTALNLISEHESCQAKSSLTIEKHWEQGQHFLLRGRAHHNIGQALYELAQYCRKTNAQDLLLNARKEFDNALGRAKSLRHNTVLISGHPNAQDASTQNNNSWREEAIVHSLEALKLESLTSVLHVACSWKLNRTKDAEERFDVFFASVEMSDLLKIAGNERVSHLDLTEALVNMYLLAMRLAELSTQSLESIPQKKGWNTKSGDELLQIIRKAMKRSASISDQLLLFLDQYSIDYAKEHIATRAAIEKEESNIYKWWEKMKTEARRKLSDVVQSARANSEMFALPRTEVSGEVGTASQGPRRIFIQDGISLQRRSLPSGTSRRVNKKKSENGAVTDRFSTEFGSGNTISPMDTQQGHATTEYRKWGNQCLEAHERKRCCPPLPDGLSIDIIRTLEKRLGDIILPTNVHAGVFH